MSAKNAYNEHNHQKKIALFSDFTGFGRCAAAVQLPLISKLHIQCCLVPTAILSNHPGFKDFMSVDFTSYIRPYTEKWENLGLTFNGICTGYLDSASQVDLVLHFIETFRTDDTIVICDPVMGDNGKLYSICTEELCSRLRLLVSTADLITPNLTEACALTDTPYKEDWTTEELYTLIRRLSDLGPKRVVITGIPRGSMLMNLCLDRSLETEQISSVRIRKIGPSRSGTGDIFTAILSADAVNGIAFVDSVRHASDFIRKAIKKAVEMEIPVTDGVPFEELM